MEDENIKTDVKNHRIRVVENIDIIYKGKEYNMFFEFTHATHYNYRTTNKRTGAPLKKTVQELIIKDGLSLDTQFEQLAGTWHDGSPYYASFRKADLEKEVWDQHLAYTKLNIRNIVNKYSKEKYTGVILIEQEAKHIIETFGGWREKDILNNNSYMEIGGTWNDDHKIVRVNKRENCVVTDFCEVDIETGKITN